MNVIGRGLFALVLLAILGFCIFGYLATFEPGTWRGLRIIYAAAVLFCLSGVAWAIFPRQPPQ